MPTFKITKIIAPDPIEKQIFINAESIDHAEELIDALKSLPGTHYQYEELESESVGDVLSGEILDEWVATEFKWDIEELDEHRIIFMPYSRKPYESSHPPALVQPCTLESHAPHRAASPRKSIRNFWIAKGRKLIQT